LHSALHTKICDILGIRYPIIQTGMGWVATPELVAAASNAGAMGFLAAATIRPEDVGEEIQKVKALTDRPFGVNFLMDAPGADLITETIIRHGVKAAGYNRAPNADLIAQLRNAGVVCVPTCGAVKHAQKAEKLGADIIIVQGGEGGGHTGIVPTSLLASESARAVGVPVVAAKNLTLRAGDEVVTYVARNLEPYRGYHIFMRALPEIQRRRPNAHVLIVGDNELDAGEAVLRNMATKEQVSIRLENIVADIKSQLQITKR